MSRPKKPSSGPGNTSHLFGSRKQSDRSGAMTRERIAEDMEAFRKAGGRIEKLGVTSTLLRIGAAPTGTAAEAPAPPVKGTNKSRR